MLLGLATLFGILALVTRKPKAVHKYDFDDFDEDDLR